MKGKLVVALALVNGSSVFAQDSLTVGDLLKKGAKRLTKAELQAIYAAGPTISGISPGGNRKFEITYSKDGSLSGRSTDEHGLRGYGLFGTWSINDAGQVCTQIRNSFGRDATPNPPCGIRFAIGDLLYSARSDEPQEPARPLTIRK